CHGASAGLDKIACCLSMAGRSKGHPSDDDVSRAPITTQLCVTGSRRISIQLFLVTGSNLSMEAVQSFLLATISTRTAHRAIHCAFLEKFRYCSRFSFFTHRCNVKSPP